MSLRRQHRKSCGRKVGYGDELDAWRAAKQWSRWKGERFQRYRCTNCGRWHIGHALARPEGARDQ